jgi:hypothetical protein
MALRDCPDACELANPAWPCDYDADGDRDTLPDLELLDTLEPPVPAGDWLEPDELADLEGIDP